MQIRVAKDYATMSRAAAAVVADYVRQKPTAVLGLATGGTPKGLYAELVRLHREEGLSFSSVITFNLDEYIGLLPEHPSSYHHYMADNLFNHIDLKPETTHLPNGMAQDVDNECRRYEAKIRQAGGIDLQILGIGANGHIGFNEPGTAFGSETHGLDLAPRTLKDNAKYFKDASSMPRQAISMGIKTIMRSRRIILLASGAGKADAVAQSIEGPVTQDVPASILQLHPEAHFFIDAEAASDLSQPVNRYAG